MNIFNGHAGPVTSGQFTPDGKKIVSTSEDTTFIVWDPKSASAEIRLSGDDARFHTEPITSVAVNKDSTLAITGDVSGKARLVNILSGQVSLFLHIGFACNESFIDCCCFGKPHRIY
jgi:ribosome assembly protein SQT1